MIQNSRAIQEARSAVPTEKPLVSVIAPAYNEAAIVERNLSVLCDYMESLEHKYRWELIVVNDGSTDGTRELADAFAKTRNNVTVVHHITNFNVGQALRSAFNKSRGDYIITVDIDLSYAPEHIGRMLETITVNRAKIVVCSPYMKGGKLTRVPWLRKVLSVNANKFLSYTSRGNLSTFTGMVRAYDGRFLRSLDLRSMDVSINAEILYKGMLLGARILEIPAHLDWSLQVTPGIQRISSIKIKRSMVAYLLSGFMFRPFIFFLLPGFALMLLSMYPFAWVFIHTFTNLYNTPAGPFTIRLSAAVAAAFQQSPHSFLIGGIMLMLAIQLVSLGVLALQNKKYFEELFHLGTSIYKFDREHSLGLRDDLP